VGNKKAKALNVSNHPEPLPEEKPPHKKFKEEM
jgi:hypothetical protein